MISDALVLMNDHIWVTAHAPTVVLLSVKDHCDSMRRMRLIVLAADWLLGDCSPCNCQAVYEMVKLVRSGACVVDERGGLLLVDNKRQWSSRLGIVIAFGCPADVQSDVQLDVQF